MSTASSGLRKRRVSTFVQIPSKTIRDKEISFRARGILAYLLDMPDGWDVKSEVIANNGKEGREAIRTALHELGRRGYYRLERRQMLDGTFGMGTAISEEPVTQWAADYAEYDKKAVPCVQQQDGSFRIKHKDGSLTTDGFDVVAVDGSPDSPDDDPPGGSTTGDGFSGPGFPGAGSPDSGLPDAGPPDSGSLGALSSTQTPDGDTDRDTDREKNLSSSEPLRAADPKANLNQGNGIEERNRGRDDVIRLCEHLAARLIENECKPPTVGVKWRDAARLLIDADGRAEWQVHNMIEWATRDSFWKANILSMPTLRDQYDKMRLRAIEEAEAAKTGMRRGYDDVATWGDRTTGPLPQTQADLSAFGTIPPADQHGTGTHG